MAMVDGWNSCKIEEFLPRMFGGDSNNPCPGYPRTNWSKNASASYNRSLFGNFAGSSTAGSQNYMGSNHSAALNHPTKRPREAVDFSMQQQLHRLVSSNQNLVSTGPRLANDDNGCHFIFSSGSESMPAALPVQLSFTDNLKAEFDRRAEALNLIRVQDEQTLRGLMQMKKRQLASSISVIKGMNEKLHEKDIELASLHFHMDEKLYEKDVEIAGLQSQIKEKLLEKNVEIASLCCQITELTEKVEMMKKEADTKVNCLKNKLQQVIQHAKEGYGDSEVEARLHGKCVSGSLLALPKQMICKICKSEEVSVFLLPCRHLCLCQACESSTNACPICGEVKSGNVMVYMN